MCDDYTKNLTHINHAKGYEHRLHGCKLLKTNKGKSVILCSCGKEVVVPTRTLRKLKKEN